MAITQSLARTLFCVFALISSSALSNTIVVDNTCSLVEAISSAENDNAMSSDCETGAGEDIIVLPSNSLQIVSQPSDADSKTALPEISSSITIQGNQSRIIRSSTAPLFRFFRVIEGGSLSLNQLTLEEGAVFGSGGAILVEQGEVQLVGVKIIDSEAIFDDAIAGAGNGGAIRARESALRIYSSEISNNTATNGAGISISNGNLEIRNSSISDNSASFIGGGVDLFGNGQFTIFNSSFSSNLATRQGGAMHIEGARIFGSDIAVIEVQRTTFDDNRSDRDGGGLFVSGEVDMQLVNSTVSGNMAQDSGGGIEAFSAENIILVNTTVTGNSARIGGGVDSTVNSSISISNSIISGNTASVQGAEVYRSGSSEVIYLGNNLLGNSSVSTEQAFWNPTLNSGVINATSNGNRPTALSSILRPLSDNGGNTFTHSLVSNSPAIDAGNAAICRTSLVSRVDQRGVRHQGICDLGSFEFGSLTPPPPPTDSEPSDAGAVVPAIILLLGDER